uniref:Spectrin repeat containing nuclear envelope protein 2 n=1 Tax=Falco tinnunculus TaxID=100819 RepID=A0A8C4V2M1_FALTI
MYTDIQQGHLLLDLLEVLSGQHLPREKGFNTFQCRSNIENALTFLKSRSLKLINIHVADIIEGKPSIVLGLIWTIIFHFHIEELARTLAFTYNQPSLDCSSAVDSSPKTSRSAKKSAKIKERWKISATKALLLWAKEQCSLYGSINVTDFKSSWRSGLPFLAIIQTLRPGLVDLEKAEARSNKENLKEAFRIAELELNIPRLLEPEDVDIMDPDEKSIMTYVAQFLQYSRNLCESEEDTQEKVGEATRWLAAQEKKLAQLLIDTENETHYQKYKEMMSFMEAFNQEKKPFLPVLSPKRNEAELSEGHQQMREEWDKLISQMNEWKAKLDQMLPSPLDSIEAWLQEVEHLLAEELPDLQDPFKAMFVFREIIVVFKGLMNCFDSHLDTLQSFKNEDEKSMPLVLPEKLEEMKRRFSNISFTRSSTFLEYHYGLCSAIANEVMLKLNISDMKYGSKESVESLLENWNNFIEEKRLETQLETATHICEDLKNKNISSPDLEISKLFKTVRSKISVCRDYISNVNTTLEKVLSSWSNYTENIHLLKMWLDENRDEHLKEIPAENLAKWNLVHGSLNEAGNYLIKVSKEQVGSNIAKELKKLNRRWAKAGFFIHLAARGTSCREQVVAAEEVLRSLTQNVSSPVFQEHSHVPGLQARIKEARGKIEVLLFYCYCTLYTQTSLILFWSFSIVMFFLQEAFNALDNKVLDKFLKAAEQLKNISPDHEKLVVEEKSKDVRRRWEEVHREIISYVQLIVEREKKKFNATFKKINKQLGKEKKLLSMDKTKGLIKEHEVPNTFLIWSPTCLCECFVCPSHSVLGTLLQSVMIRSVRQSITLSLWLFYCKMLSVFSCLLSSFIICYLSCRTNSLRTALEIVLPIENESILLCELDQRLKKKEIQQLNLMNSDLAYRELKELQRSILNQIEVCKQLEHLESSARDEFNPIDLQAASKIMIYYQNQLEEMSHKMQIRETVLKDLEDFMASLRKCQSSIKCLTDPPGHPETQGKALREAAQEVSRMVEKAKCLDERLKTVDICLEDGECGRKTCCENLVLTLSEALKATCDSSSEQMLSEEKDLYEIFSTKNCELLKNIQDLCDRINKIGLKDPTIPAVQQRLKSLMELEKELDRVAVEMKPMQEIANKLLQIKEEKAEEANEQCRVTERLWEDTKLLLAECQEQCARALELLKQYQSCKTSLTSIIQKQEIMLSQQASYMGKENLNRLITKIEEAKEEFNEHSEDVDKINQICKNLQLQLNKMRSFEEPPFENEANIIVDRWLDINEKTENYCDNLGRVQALWDKLLGLSGAIDAWANAELKNAENHCLTEEDLTQLKACLRVQEQKLQKFDNTVAEIEELLNSNEPPLELQVIRSSVVQKMELIKELLSMKQGTSELSMNTAELKGDLDLAKTQIGMTESLLKALSPSDTLEIFTKLEEIHQKILQQEHLVTLLQEETDCPDVDELNKQLKCVIDLFNKKKRVFQDHFIGVLNRQCKNFNDWFSSTQLSLKDCFDLSETKPIMEERLQRLTRFLTSEGKDRDIQEVKTLLDKVKHYLSKASIIHLNSCVRDQEAELQRLVSKCQKREKELGASLQQLSSLEESSTVLEEWLIAQEEKLKEIQKDETKLENFYKTLLAQRKPFDSMAQLVNSLRETGLTEHETVSEAAHLLSRYQTLITHVSEMTGNTERLPVEGQNFEELVQDVSCWIKKLEEAVNNLSSQGSELPSDKRINQIKEITALRDAGEAKIQKMVALGETLMKNEKSRKPVVQQTISELQNKWESICHAVFFPSPQEQLQFNRERYEQSKEDLRLALTEVEKQQQEIGFALQPGLKEKQAQLTNYANLLQKAENLTSRFNELESQEDCLQGHTGDSCFPEMEWLELKHQHENLLSQLQTIVQTLESHVQEHQQFQDMVTGLSTELKTVSEKLAACKGPAIEQPSAEKNQLKSQVCCSRCEDMLKKILVLAETVKQNTSSPGQKFIKDEIETLQSKHRSLEERLENVEQKEENIFTEVLELKDEFGNEMQMEDKADAMLKRETRITSDTPVATEKLWETLKLLCWEVNTVCAEVVVQKELFPGVQVNTEYFEEEQKVNELKNKVAELDIVLINEQLKELENLQTELETWKAKSLCHSQEAFPSATGSNRAELQTTEPALPCWDKLLQELDAVKAVKQQQYCLINEYQKNLSAAQSSMKNLSTEKDNIKISPMNNTVLLEKIKACIESLRKERDVLNQLKTQQESLSQHLTGMDKVLTESQMRQLELWWQHMEQTVQKKHDQVVAEIDEFNLLMNKAQDIQKLIQEQCLQVELHSSAAGKAKYPVLWMTELQDIKHGLSLLTRRIELQMKRIWSDQEKVALESSIRDLQSKLEALSAQQTPREDVQITGPALMKHEMMKKMKENISWVKDSLSSLDQKAALFPSDVKSQIRSCQLMSTEVLNREPVIVSLDYGLQHIMPSLKPEEVSDMKFLLQTLQDSYKALVLKSAQRLQHLELQLEERQRLIAEIEKVHCQLRNAEMLARPDMNQTSTWSELIDRQAILKEILKDVQEIEGLISSHYKESQITAEELSLSEQLFLIDQLRSLKNRAKKTQRQIQSKLHEVEKKIAVYKEFAEGITSLQQDLVLQYGEMNLEEDELLGSEQELKDKCKALQKKVLAFQFNLSQIMKYKEIFECVGLKWDSLQLDELQTKFFKIKNKIKGKIIHFDNVVRECDKIQVLLNEIQAITSTVRKEADILNDGSCSSPAENLMSAQILFQAVQQILYLTQEVANKINKNDILDTRFKESKRKEIKSLEKDAEELNQFLQNLISGLHCVNKEDIQNEVEYIFHIIKHIQLELQQPLLIDIKLMQYEKLRWEAIQKMMQAKFSAINCIMEKERKNPKEKSLAAGIETKLETLQDHETQLKIDIAARVSALEEACKAGELYTKAVQRAATFLEDYEAGLQSATAELGSSEEICQTPQWNQEEFNSAKADIENVYSKLKNLVKPEDKICLENTLTELVSKSLALREKAQRKEADEQRYFEKYKSYTKTKDKVCDNLNKLEKMLRQSLSQIPTSYKEALEHLEESKILVSNIDLAEDDLVKLRQVSGDLMKLCCRNDRALGRIVTVLWENWLSLLEAAKGLEINCEELKQEWKFINEELEREAIILDKLQEEQPESLKEKEKATREELVELLDFVNSFEENINQQQLLLLLLLHRIRNILNTSENTEAEAALPALCEIKAMQDRCKKLYEKTQDHKDSVQAEIQERNKITEEISAVTNALRHAASGLSQDAAGKAGQLEEVQSVIGKENQTLKDIMEKLRTKYSEMHTTVPAEIQTQLEDSKKVLQDLEDKVSFEILQSSPQYVLKRKAETINNGLQAIEKMLQQKSENIAKAKEVQKQIWDMLDLWHYKLNELDEEVHDIVEQNSCHAQELMDILVTPLQQYQQVSQLAERRTAILNKAANKMEEYDELLKNVKVWIENTNCLLKADAQINSGKSLRKHTDNLQMALEDSEQKQKLLHSVYLELEELTPVFETDSIMQQLNEINDQVATLQHEIAEILPQIQHVADELDAIESHVKVFEKEIAKMKTILSSEDLLEFSPKDQLQHGQVILDRIGPMQKTIAHIQSYKESLQLPGVKMQPFSVFQTARQLLRELKKLEKITKEQSDLLEVTDLISFSFFFLSPKPPITTFLSCGLLQSNKPRPAHAGKAVAHSGLEPEVILQVCQAQVAEMDQWLDQTKVSLRSDPQTPKMQHMVEQQLADCQVRLSDIEQKVLSLMGGCGDSPDYQQETESLSLKLKEVKSNLEEVQRMLQDTYDEDQVKHMNTMQSKSERVIVICYSNSVFALLFLQYSNGESDPKSKQPDPTFAPKDQADNKWQHFQQDLSSEMKSPLCQLVEPPVRLNLVKHSFCRQLCDKKDDLLKCIGCAGESTDEFCKCFNNLQAWLEQTAAATASRSNSMKDELDHNSNYQNETRLLYDQLTEKKATLQQSLNAIRGHNISEQLQKTNACVLELEDFENKVAKLRGFGERFQLPTALIQEVYKLEDVLDDMWGILKAKYEELYSPSTIDSQYEDLLRGFADLVAIGQEKIAQDPKQLTKSKAALQSHLENHKDFFHNLMIRLAFMQAFSKKVTPSILQKREEFWQELVNDVKLLEQKAIQYGIHLESLLKEWMEFDDECLVFNKELEALASALPSVNLVEETEERLMERIALLEQIKSSVDEKHARLYQMVKEGKKLMAAVSCPEIRSQIGKLEEQRLSLTKKVGHELHRLQTLLKLLISYNRDSEELMKWLDSAQQRINFWTEQSLNVSPDLPTIRDNINSLLAFSKEADEKSSLKTSVVSTANQLFHVKQADTTALRSSLAKFEQKWGEMTTQLSAIQEKLHQLQMEKLSSREAIAELMAWLDHVEQQLGHEEPINSQRSAAQVKSLLQKYKEYMMEMNFKQWTVDFVNQSLLQMSTCDVESKRYERTEFAECLGELNLRWHRLQASLNRKIQDLEYILEDIIENENKAQTLHNWLEAQSDQLRSLQTPASLISAQNTLDVCKELENQLTIKSKTLDELKQSLALNGSVEQSPESPSLRIAELLTKVICLQVAQLKTSMQSILEQWRVYDEAYAEVSLMTTRYLYCINHCKPSVASLEALEKQVNTLQSLQDESESSEESWAKLQAAASNLKKNCSPSFAEIMEQKCMEAHTRWNSVNEDITDQLRAAQATMQLLEPLNTSCTEAAAKLQQHEEQYNQLLDAHMPEDNMIETLHQRIQDIRVHDYVSTSGTTAETILLEKCEPLQRAHYLEKMLQRKLNEFEAVFFAINLFFYFQNHTLELAALSPNVKSLNETSVKLPLSDFTLKKMQSLTRLWSQKRAAALEHWRSERQTKNRINDDEKKIFQKCENWMKFLEKMRDALKTNIPERFEELKEQQRVYEVNLEVKIPEHSTLVIFRREFISKLLLLKEQWQNLTQTVLQRKKDIDGLVSQWQLFRSSQQSLGRFLDDMNNFLAALKSQGRYSPHHVRNLIHDCKIKAVILQRWQAMYSLTIDVGEKLRTVTDPETSSVLQEELSQLQQSWGNVQALLEKNKMAFIYIIQLFEKRTKELESRVQELKEKSEDLLPVEHEELYKAKEHIKELEQSLADCTPNMKDLLRTKVYVGYCFFTEDMKVLREQAERLHRQWEELCLRVSLRKQEIEDRLNAWIVFNEKNKELCSWLVQMESKVLQTADVSIEDMIDKLQKDCMEEINLFSENKLQLKQMGDQLIKASSKNRVAEIDDKLNKINDRWQHLFDVIGARVKKLKETFAFIQLLDKNMSNLRTWLARIESELSKPVVYDICDDQEIQKRLAEQQDLQRDIEQHTAGVESVFNICEVLLHDSDACANETECDSIQQTTRSLDRRWRNICAMSMERRMKIEETWHLWQRFFDDYSRFEDWLKSSEMIAAKPNSSEVLYTHAKEELKKFEAFQRHVHERLTQLELINKQYRRLARENRTDSASKLKQMVHEGNQRWDNLQKRVAAILRRLKHFTSRRDEFEGLRESILVWLTEMDLQLTNVEHFSKSNFDDKMRQLNGFQQEITLNTNKIDQLIVFGEQLIQKSEPLDATLIEGELEELHRYCQEVFGRVARFHQRLTSRHPGLDDEKESSENETDPEDSGEIQNDPWHKKASAAQSLGQLMPPAQGHERSGCETPVSVDSIPLEWDHTGDVGGSSSPEDEEEATYYSALSEKSLSEAHPWHSPDSPVCRKRRYHQSKIAGNVLSGPETSTPYKPDYVSWRLYGAKSDTQELSGSPDTPKDHKLSLTFDGIIDRWELIQAQDLRNKLQMKQKWQQWQQLNSDLGDVSAWLDKTEEKLEELQKMKPPTSIQALGQRVKKLKDILKAFDNYRAVMLSINRSSKEFQEADSTELKELQNKLQKVNLHWETVAHVLNNWKKGLQQALLHCQDFHDQSQKLTLWLASADRRRDEAQITDPNADLNTILKSQKELMQLEKELLEQQRNISPLQELTASLLPKSQGDCIQDGEKVHVIGSKLKRLTEQVSDDLKTIQGNLVSGDGFCLPVVAALPTSSGLDHGECESNNNQATPQSSSFFYRVLRAALPFQLSFLILLLLAFMVPFSEEDYSCTRANNFARSFSLMLVYTNGPPPT